jgi:hypothetical protein
MNEVYVLQHEYELEGHDEYKFIGVYSSREKAEAAVARLITQPGFRDHPDGFCISACTVDDRDGWSEGFCAMTTIFVEVQSGLGRELRCVEAELLPGQVYEITAANDSPDSEQWAFKRDTGGGSRHLVAVEVVQRAARASQARDAAGQTDGR